MAQTITTQNWTEITGLDNAKKYVLQAQYKSEYGNTVYGSQPINIMWLQQSSDPQTDDVGVIDSQIKVSGSEKVYVKTLALPCNIIVQEVI